MNGSKLLGLRIQELRREAGLTQQQVADAVGVGAAHMSKVEHGREAASDRLLAALTVALGAQRDELALMAGRVPADIHAAIVDLEPLQVEWLRDTLARPPACVETTRGVLAIEGAR